MLRFNCPGCGKPKGPARVRGEADKLPEMRSGRVGASSISRPTTGHGRGSLFVRDGAARQAGASTSHCSTSRQPRGTFLRELPTYRYLQETCASTVSTPAAGYGRILASATRTKTTGQTARCSTCNLGLGCRARVGWASTQCGRAAQNRIIESMGCILRCIGSRPPPDPTCSDGSFSCTRAVTSSPQCNSSMTRMTGTPLSAASSS
jgi:hypothetical protein